MVMERTEDRGTLQFVKFREFLIGAWGAAAVGKVQAGQRSDAVNAVRKSLGLVVGRLEIAPRLNLFPDVIVVLVGIEIVSDHMTGGIDDAQLAPIEGEAIVFFD